MIATFFQAPTVFEGEAPTRNHLRFRISPEMTIAMEATIMGESEVLKGDVVEMVASHRPGPEEMEAYERVLGDALAGDSSHFAREDYVEEAWRIIDPILLSPAPVQEYERNTWGPTDPTEALTPPGGWHDPVATQPAGSRNASLRHKLM